MGFDFSKVKRKVRQVVHATLAVTATYQDSTMSNPINIKARWLTKMSKTGDLDSNGYADVFESIDRIVLDSNIASSIPVIKGGVVTFTSYVNENGKSPSFMLAVKELTNGPVEEVWEVTRA